MELRIRNFGPIANGFAENDGFMTVKPVTILCGPQGTGKSCVAKIVSTMAWIEKALVRGDFNIDFITKYNRFVKYCANQNIQNFFKENTELSYHGYAYDVIYEDGHLTIEEKDNSAYKKPQIAYIPAERNLLSAIEHVENLKNLPVTLSWMRDDFYRALQNMGRNVNLPIDNVQLTFDRLNKIPRIESYGNGPEYKIRLSEASSGIQSIAPLFMVLKYMSDGIGNSEGASSVKENEAIKERVRELLKDDSLSPETRRLLIEEANDSSNKRLFAIVEEPEQNLYPLSQKNMLFALLEINNSIDGNCMLLTTHSPYILDYLTLAIKAKNVSALVQEEHLKERIGTVVPPTAWMKGGEVAIYQINNHGDIELLPSYDGMPSDENRLNIQLAETNDMFNTLMDIEELCQR